MPIGLPRPSGQGVRTLHKKLITDWDECIRKDERFRDLVYQRNKVEMLEGNDELRLMKTVEIHSGRAGGIIDHGVALLMALPEFHGDPTNLTTEEKRDVEQVEKVAAALFEQQLLANDFWNHVGRDILIYSRAFVKAIPLPHVWTTQSGYPVRGVRESAKDYLAKVRDWKTSEGRFPFVITHVPALSILPHLDANDNVLASIEEKIVTAKVLAEELGSKKTQEALSRQALKWYDELTVIEYMDTEWVAYLLVDTTPVDKSTDKLPHERAKAYEILRTWRHGLGKHPITMIPGIRTEMDNYRDRFKGFLADAEDALKTYDALLSRLATMVYAYYLPSYSWTIPMDTAKFKGRSTRPTLQINLGGVTPLYSDEILATLPIPQGLPDATLLLQQMEDNIQRATFDDVLLGRVEGSAAAFQVNLRINMAKSALTPLAQHMAQGLTNVFELFLRGVQQLKEAVIIDGEKITVSMAKKYQNRLSVQIEPKSPIDRSQDMGAAAMALDLGFPWDWVAEKIVGVENPATLRLEKDIQEIERLPEVQKRLMEDALEQLEIMVEDDELTDLEGIDLEALPPEVKEAVTQLLGGGEEGAENVIPLTALGEDESGEPAAPFAGTPPEGADPRQLSPRGLGTPNRQPSPGSAQVGDLSGLA